MPAAKAWQCLRARLRNALGQGFGMTEGIAIGQVLAMPQGKAWHCQNNPRRIRPVMFVNILHRAAAFLRTDPSKLDTIQSNGAG